MSLDLARRARFVALYLRPHLFAAIGGVAFAFGVRYLTSLSGSCRVFCYPPITLSLGLLGGLIGAQLYRADHPVRLGQR